MSLENRLAYWVDLGCTSYTDTYELQVKITHLKQNGFLNKDVILTTEHHPEINFGSAKDHNLFSDEFLEEVKKLKGPSYTQQDIIDVLKSRGFSFSETSRGGGATVIAPGQIIFYPVVDYEKIVGRPLGVGDYKNLIDKILYNVISRFDIPNLTIASGLIKTAHGIRDRRDVWTNISGRDFKIGSKGIKNSGNVAYHGFVIYAGADGVKPFSYVKPCGYEHDEVSVISIEEITGKKVDKEVVKELTKDEIKKQFRYDNIDVLTIHELNSLLNRQITRVPTHV